MTTPTGYLCLMLHAHLPFVRHPEYEDFLEEDWLYEAITETYIPLLDMMDGLERDRADWRRYVNDVSLSRELGQPTARREARLLK